MILVLLLLPLVGALVAGAAARVSARLSRWLALLTMLAGLALGFGVWAGHPAALWAPGANWMLELDHAWLPTLGIRFHLAMDGLSLLLVQLTFFLGAVAVLVSWREIDERVGFFHLCLLLAVGGISAVFLAADLFLFYFAWELMLVPMYFLIAIWGHEHRRYAAMKFFIFTQAGGLLMLVAILALSFLHYRQTHVLTFQYTELLTTRTDGAAGFWIMLGFLAAFLVKLPAVPVHTWLPDAHTEAPTAGSVVLAGLLLKTGAYGLLRFVLPIFPAPAAAVAPLLMALGAAGILYGALLAFAQSDLKRLVAYTSVSHMGFVLLGAFAADRLAWQGAVVQMLAHGLSTGALFVVAGIIQARLHTRDLRAMGGLWTGAPLLGGLTIAFVMSSAGLPGLGDFVGELLVLLGVYRTNPALAVVAALGMIAGATYALKIVQDAFHGPNVHALPMRGLVSRERALLLVMLGGLLWLGLSPRAVTAALTPAAPTQPATAMTPEPRAQP